MSEAVKNLLNVSCWQYSQVDEWRERTQEDDGAAAREKRFHTADEGIRGVQAARNVSSRQEFWVARKEDIGCKQQILQLQVIYH